jgi:hypothetical protein
MMILVKKLCILNKFDEIALYKPNIRDESFIIPSLTVSATSPGRSGPKKSLVRNHSTLESVHNMINTMVSVLLYRRHVGHSIRLPDLPVDTSRHRRC